MEENTGFDYSGLQNYNYKPAQEKRLNKYSFEEVREFLEFICKHYPLELIELTINKNNVIYLCLLKSDKYGYRQYFERTVHIADIDCKKIRKAILKHYKFLPHTVRTSRLRRFINKLWKKA